MKHVKRFSFPCMLLIVLVFLLPGTEIASAAAISNCGQWNVVTSPNVKSTNMLTAVTAVSANDVWAVGYSEGAKFTPQPLIEHWDGSSWKVITSPTIKHGAALYGIAAVSANDIWAVGNEFNVHFFNGKGLAEHWNGSKWSEVPNPGGIGSGSIFHGVTAIASNDVWAAGLYYYTTNGSLFFTFAEHWNGTKWSEVSPPMPTQNDSFAGISAISDKDIWAVGASFGIHPNTATLAEHWDGSQWSFASTPNVGKISQLNGVASVSTNDVWAVGQSGNSSSPKALIENWNGSSWSIASNPGSSMNGTLLNGVAALSANNVWAVGQSTNKSGVSQTFIEHWDGTKWSIVSSPNVGSMNNTLNGVGGFIGTTQVWAAGSYTASTGNNTLIESYC